MYDDKIVFEEYIYKAISGYVYHPEFNTRTQNWSIVYPSNLIALDKLVILCNIPTEEAIFLKLKYGS
jgi:hypothetical protein